MSDTPRTDALSHFCKAVTWQVGFENMEALSIQLERELATADAEFQHALTDLSALSAALQREREHADRLAKGLADLRYGNPYVSDLLAAHAVLRAGQEGAV